MLATPTPLLAESKELHGPKAKDEVSHAPLVWRDVSETPLTQTQRKQRSAGVSHPESTDHMSKGTLAVHKAVPGPSRAFFTALSAIHLRKSCRNAQKLTAPRHMFFYFNKF